jgi:phosphatidylserine/phosphatidylglycerophosphate/cardiolipin synthase-like enzyme
VYITQNASAFLWETGKKPSYEYDTDSMVDVPQMKMLKHFILSNKGEAVALKDRYNHTIDALLYGNCSHDISGWNGTSVPCSGEGYVLTRNFDNNLPLDFDTASDWRGTRKYGVGQSNFLLANVSFYGEVIGFVSPDCSYKTIVDELGKARESIYLNMYEFTDPFLCEELIFVLKRNVSVFIFVEGAPVGGIDEREQYILQRIANYGGKVRFIVNDPDNHVHARYVFNHGKYVIIDDSTAIIESCNWGRTGVPVDPTFGNREWGVVIRNKTVAGYFLSVFLDDWNPMRCDSYSIEEMDLLVSSDFYLGKSIFRGVYEPQFAPCSIIGNFSTVPVISPDTSLTAISDLIKSAHESIYIEQLYIYKDWDQTVNPFVDLLAEKSRKGVDIKVILNFNPDYIDTNEKCNKTKQYLEEHGIEVKFVYTNWSYFTNVHNKGMIVDNQSVLISSINWNMNSVLHNREIGIILENNELARYYAQVFFYDWNLELSSTESVPEEQMNYKNTIYIMVIFTMTFALIARDWRKREW